MGVRGTGLAGAGWPDPSLPATQSLILGGNSWGLRAHTKPRGPSGVPEQSAVNEMALERKELSMPRQACTEMKVMGKPVPGPSGKYKYHLDGMTFIQQNV